MCGIHGFVSTRRPADELSPAVAAMVACSRHRGPDAAAQVVARPAGPAAVLGHNRLAIIDLSPTGAQPMSDPETGNWLVFNGEIYNFAELRGELEAAGRVFRGRSDTEVILHAYARWGRDCVARFRGIFAFGLWDARARRLLLARDQLGVKPLYYALPAEGLVFSSEVRGVLASGAVERRLDVAGLHGYLRYGSVQEPGTLVRGIQSLPPAHVLEWSAEAGVDGPRAYWRLEPAGPEAPLPPDMDAGLRAELERAVRLQLVSDVPLGVFLSGGVDSATVASLACRSSRGPVRTFCIGFKEAAFDESRYARAIAAEIGSTHQELILGGEDVRVRLPEVLAAYDQPSMDGINTYFVSQLIVRQGMKVALSGLGGDEVFAGYDAFAKARLLDRWAPCLRAASGLARLLPGWRPTAAGAQALAALGEPDLPAPYFAARIVYHRRWSDALLAGLGPAPTDSPWQARQRALAQAARGLDPVNRASFLELQHYMLNTLLRDSDQMSMAHSLELRVPLLDHVLVERALALPGAVKIEHGRAKARLLAAMGRDLPATSYSHPKQGFTFPFADWFKKELRQPLHELFAEGRAALPWGADARAKLWTAFAAGQLGWARLWTVYAADWWAREHRITP